MTVPVLVSFGWPRTHLNIQAIHTLSTAIITDSWWSKYNKMERKEKTHADQRVQNNLANLLYYRTVIKDSSTKWENCIMKHVKLWVVGMIVYKPFTNNGRNVQIFAGIETVNTWILTRLAKNIYNGLERKPWVIYSQGFMHTAVRTSVKISCTSHLFTIWKTKLLAK